MSLPRLVAVAPLSPAARAGLASGDEVLSLNGTAPRDILEWRQLTDEPEVEVEVRRHGITLTVAVEKSAGEPLGAEVHSSVFDRVRTCDNHCEFCFIYQLPPGLRKSLYLKDDDYRLSFLYGNFTTLTRFTEADLERVITERLSPLHVSIHATDPDVRSRMLRNRRGATSLRWLRALLDAGIEVRGQVVVCPGVNDGDVLTDTLTGVLDTYPELSTLAIVPLGISKFSTETALRAHTVTDAAAVVDTVEEWQDVYLRTLGRRLAFCADEYYLLAERSFPPTPSYEGCPMHEDGVGMARTFEQEFLGRTEVAVRPKHGFFQWADTASRPDGYRFARTPERATAASASRPPIGILTGEYGARVLSPLVAGLRRDDIRVITVRNEFFGGTTAVTGLMVGADIARTLAGEPEGHRYLLPDVCLNEGRFLDDTTTADLPRAVEIVATDGIALRGALG